MRLESRHVYSSSTDGMSLEVSLSNPDTSSSSSSSKDWQVGSGIIYQTNDMGAGNVPSQELPARPKSSTPAELEAEYKVERDKILEYLKDILAINEKMGLSVQTLKQ